MPFTEYWPADLPRSLVERIAASAVFAGKQEIRPPDDDVLRCGPDLRVQITRAADVVVLAVHGSVDLANAVRLRAVILFVLTGRRPRGLVVDASGVTLGSVSGLTVLIEAAEAAAAVHASYAVAGLNPMHLRLIHEIRPGDRHAHLEYATVPDAVAAVRGILSPDPAPPETRP